MPDLVCHECEAPIPPGRQAVIDGIQFLHRPGRRHPANRLVRLNYCIWCLESLERINVRLARLREEAMWGGPVPPFLHGVIPAMGAE